MNKRKNKKDMKIIIFSLFLISVGVSVFALYLAQKNVPVGQNIFKVKFSVSDKKLLGINADKYEDLINFGILPNGSVATKKVAVTNRFGKDLIVKVLIGDSLKEHLFCKDSFTLEKGKTLDIPFLLDTKDLEKGDYEGSVRVVYYSK